MDVLQDIGSSIIGSIHKAKLFIKKSDGAVSNIALREKLLQESEHTLLKNPGKSLGTVAGKDYANAKEESGYHVLQVKYNPSTIRMSTQAGTYNHCGVGAMGINQITQITMPSETNMTVELVFDDMNIPDAFMWEKYQLSVGSAISSTAGVVKQFTQNGYSVQAQIDGLIGLITQENLREVVFYWSEMAFAGEVTNVQAKYTMFNPQGHPVRGTVALTICQITSQEKQTADEEYWKRAFDDLFGDYTEINTVEDKTSRVLDAVGNIFNI